MAAIPTLAETIKDTNLVTMKLLVDGKELSNKYQIVTMTILQEVNKIPTAHIMIVDGEADKEDFAVSSSNDFKPGKKIEIQLGYTSKNVKVFTGIIISNAIKITNDCSEMNVEAKDETVKMTITKSNHYFNDKSDYDIKAPSIALDCSANLIL